MAVQVADTLTQKNSGSFPLVDGNAVAGGLQIFQTTTERDALGDDMKKVGMIVYVVDEDTHYKLMSDGSWSTSISSASTSTYVEDATNGDYVLI